MVASYMYVVTFNLTVYFDMKPHKACFSSRKKTMSPTQRNTEKQPSPPSGYRGKFRRRCVKQTSLPPCRPQQLLQLQEPLQHARPDREPVVQVSAARGRHGRWSERPPTESRGPGLRRGWSLPRPPELYFRLQEAARRPRPSPPSSLFSPHSV